MDVFSNPFEMFYRDFCRTLVSIMLSMITHMFGETLHNGSLREMVASAFPSGARRHRVEVGHLAIIAELNVQLEGIMHNGRNT